MTDKELLEFSAKAAGIELWWDVAGNLYQNPTLPTIWNPLTDDGDALRLAVKLSLLNEIQHCIELYIPSEEFDADEYAATRRAIVMAAAYIGKGMK